MSNTTPNNTPAAPWYKELSRYHWFVFIVCCLGWGLDCFCQQIFNLMRNPALADLLNLAPTDPTVAKYMGIATAVLLCGWGTGGILFGVMSDKYGRARMMIVSIFVYATFIGLCGLATSLWTFFLSLFLCGAGVGGQFASGVTLLSETMPDKARPKSLGLLQVFAAFCNMCTGTLVLVCGILQTYGFFSEFPVWRFLFIVGFAPAILAFAVMRHLEEPKAWRDAIAAGGVKKAGSIPDLFRHPRWRYNVILGMCLATCGVIGLWGIGFFSIDLTRMAFRGTKNAEARKNEGIEKLDFEFVRMLASNPKELMPIADEVIKAGKYSTLTPQSFIGKDDDKTNDAGAIYQIILENRNSLDGLNAEGILAALDISKKDEKGNELRKAQTPEEKERRKAILGLLSPPVVAGDEEEQNNNAIIALQPTVDENNFRQLTTELAERAKSIGSYVTIMAGLASLLFNFGAFVGTWFITLAAERFGRRIAFTMFFTASFFVTLLVFLTMGTGTLLGSPVAEVFVLQPLLGFCVLSIFGGYAIYFPELFPTRLRSTAVSFCYNIARFAAAAAPVSLGYLTVFYSTYNVGVPMRYAGATMAVTFIIGIICTWMGPETKGQPLPEE